MGKKIQAKEYRCPNRKQLQDIIPLPAPFVVYIEPANVCNFRCSFCPTGDFELLKKVHRPSGIMSMELFRKIVDDLSEFGEKLSLVNMYKDGEPLLNKHFPEMVRYLKDAGISDRIWTKTNGALLNPRLNRELIDAGITWIGISVEAASKEGYKKIASADIDYDKFIGNIKDLYEHRGNCEIYIKTVDYGQPHSEIEKFYADFQDICSSCAVEKLMGWSYSDIKDFTLGTHPDTYDGLPFTEKDVCSYPFYVMSINFNGSVSLCGNDWSHNTVVGNVKDESLKGIWKGEKLFEFRKMLLEGRRKENLACGKCYYLKIVPDNIDAYKEQILKKLILAR